MSSLTKLFKTATTSREKKAQSRLTSTALRAESLEDRRMMTAGSLLNLPTMPVAVGDFNADGYEDVATGIPDATVAGREDAGLVRVVYGSASGKGYAGGALSQTWSQNTRGISGDIREQNLFGSALAVGDFNGDRVDDLAISAPGERGVHIIFGTTNGLSAQAEERVLRHQNSNLASGFGHSLAVGDFDGDGRDDLAVGAPYRSKAYVYYRGDDGFRGDEDYSESNVYVEEHWSDLNRFGWSLAVGDFDANGVDDLAIGIPQATHIEQGCGVAFVQWLCFPHNEPDAGAVSVLYGRAVDGLSGARSEFWTQNVLNSGSSEGDLFGAALAAGDLNWDGIDDLAIGVPREDIGYVIDAGLVNVVYGTTALGLERANYDTWTQNSSGVPGTAQALDYFGAALAIGDFNGRRGNDLAIGVPGEDITTFNEGAINVLYSTWYGLSASGSEYLHQNKLSALTDASRNEYFGASLAAGNIDLMVDQLQGESDEIVVGVPRENLGSQHGQGPAVHLIWVEYEDSSTAVSNPSGGSTTYAKDYLWALFGDFRTATKYGIETRGFIYRGGW